ncbi:MAG: DEAD/DEAH box helicase [Gemmatimonadetes bacterium]|nr:DEAD/DEAH box helicase [Gemmatimonadota bacterium]
MTAPPSPRWPRVVAEALAELARPLAMAPTTTRPATRIEVERAWRDASRPAATDTAVPAFLLPQQHAVFQRVCTALAEWHGAILAEPVGAGKTWIALAVARSEARPTVVIGPAILEGQWRAAAARSGVAINWWSHERLSRGRLPSVDARLVIVDEAHRLREPATRRVTTLAPWLRGRRTLLLTATPIVNRLDDLVTLLRLFLTEDALRLDGIPALGALGALTVAPVALQRVVIRGETSADASHPARAEQAEASVDEVARGERAVAIVRRLTQRHRAAWSRLLALVLLDAAASSDLAFREALRRYRALLAQARDAGGGDRVTLRRFAGEALDQLVWWDLVGAPNDPVPLPVDDLPRLDAILAAFVPADAAWLEPLRRHATGVPTVWFTRHRATAALLRTAWGEGTAWVTGDAAGIGPHRLRRDAVLAAFGPERNGWHLLRTTPTQLVTTDVAAEGLDLQAAGRLVHVDLPWTATRMAQREGRLLRLGQQHTEVALVLRLPTPPIESELANLVRVARKGALAARWLDSLTATPPPQVSAPPGIPCAVVQGHATAPPSDLLVVEITDLGTGRRGVMTLTRSEHRDWSARPEGMSATAQRTGQDGDPMPGMLVHEIVDSAMRWAVREAHRRASWGPPRLVARIHRLARIAAWHRDAAAIARLEASLRWCTSAPTLGDRLRIEALATADDTVLIDHQATAATPVGPYAARAVGVVLFRSGGRPLRCPDADLPDHPLRPRRDVD